MIKLSLTCWICIQRNNLIGRWIQWWQGNTLASKQHVRAKLVILAERRENNWELVQKNLFRLFRGACYIYGKTTKGWHNPPTNEHLNVFHLILEYECSSLLIRSVEIENKPLLFVRFIFPINTSILGWALRPDLFIAIFAVAASTSTGINNSSYSCKWGVDTVSLFDQFINLQRHWKCTEMSHQWQGLMWYRLTYND